MKIKCLPFMMKDIARGIAIWKKLKLMIRSPALPLSEGKGARRAGRGVVGSGK
jgi:hypothetical protein